MSNFYEAGKAAMTSNKDDWETPQQLFDYLDLTYHFTLDPCSTHENAKCAKHYTIDEDGLSQSWDGETVFCNPPYGRDMYEWVRKCAMESRHAKVVMLIPARTDTRYFHDFIYRKPDVRYEFLRGRLKFEVGGGYRSIRLPSRRCSCTSGARRRPMAETEGKLLTCDLCGATMFLKYVETKDYDGGFTRLRTFEKKPEGWQTWHVSNVINSTLCPTCNERMQEALLECIGKIKGEDQDG